MARAEHCRSGTLAPPRHRDSFSLLGWLSTPLVFNGMLLSQLRCDRQGLTCNQISIDTLGEPLPLVVGNAVALFSPFVYSPLLTYLSGPQDFRWERFDQGIRAVDDSDVAGMTEEQLAQQHDVEEADNDSAFDERMKRASLLATYSSIVSPYFLSHSG